MIALIQRTSGATLCIAGDETARIGPGLVALIGVVKSDTEANARRLAERVRTYRVFPDADGRMNRSLADTGGGLLLVPNFTLAADTDKGTRAGFSTGAPPEAAEQLFNQLVHHARAAHGEVQCGVFGADMQITLTNDGPVTFWLEG